MLIDTGYEEHGAAVRDALDGDGYEIEAVVLSHFHPDHVLGLNALRNVAVLGSPRFEETLREYGEPGEWRAFVPSRIVRESDEIPFGRFRLGFRFAPGHSPCSLATLLDDDYVHVADNVMLSNDGQQILPWAPFDRVSEHIESLEMLRSYARRTWLLSHGTPIDDARVAERAIENRIRYFRRILAGNGRISYEEAVADCDCDFLHREWLVRRDDV